MLTSRKQISVKVFYTWGESVLKNKFDPGFGKNISWDIPLLEGYAFTFVKNVATDPGSHHFKGIDNPDLTKEIEDWNANAILVYGWSFKSHLKVMRHFHRRVPVFFRGDSTMLGRKNYIQLLLRKYFLKWVYSHVDAAFYAGTNNKVYFQQHGLGEERLFFAPHAVDNGRFADEEGASQRQAEEWRTKLGIKPHESVLIYAGKLEPIKNLEWLIDTIRQADELKVKVLLVGNGPLEKKLKEKASGDKRFIFIDFQNQKQMPVVYRLGQIFILCSQSETWGLSVNEAMASGRAILVNENCGCAADLVKNGINGFVFNNANKNLFIHCVRELIDDEKLVLSMGEQSKRIIHSWNFEEVCKSLEAAMASS